MKAFSPKRLRANSGGRFLFKDYQDHCEQGGHPVPRGIPLLGSHSRRAAQVLLVDLLTHVWRTWDQVRNWLGTRGSEQQSRLPEGTVAFSDRLHEWGDWSPGSGFAVEKRGRESVVADAAVDADGGEHGRGHEASSRERQTRLECVLSQHTLAVGGGSEVRGAASWR